MPGSYAIVANVAGADSCLRLGARVVVRCIPGNPAHVQVEGLTRGGRRVFKWVPSSRLTNIRAAWENRPPFACSFETKDEAERCIAERFG